MNIEKVREIVNRKVLDIPELEKLPTPRLLAYMKSIRSLEHFGRCGCCSGEIVNSDDIYRNEIGHEYVNAIRTILNTREHIGKQE